MGNFHSTFQTNAPFVRGAHSAPLIYHGMDALSWALIHETAKGRLHGVQVDPINTQGTHSFYADDIALILQEGKSKLSTTMRAFDNFGRASGLYINWQKTNAAFISKNAWPTYLEELNWLWETRENASKLLGFPVAQEIPLLDWRRLSPKS